METLSNATFAIRVATSFIAFCVIGYVCGFYGALYLAPTSNIGPVTAYFTTLPTGLIGGIAATYGCVNGFDRRRYVAFMAIVTLVVIAVLLFMVWGE